MPGPVVDPQVTPEQRINAAAQVIMLRTALDPQASIQLAAEVWTAMNALTPTPPPRCGAEDKGFVCNREPGHPPLHEAYAFDHTTPVRTWE